jgi:hypothetical protein
MLANSASPLLSTNPNPELKAGSDAEGPVPCANAGSAGSKHAAQIVATTMLRRLAFPRLTDPRIPLIV